jgi:hypothetical protein
MSGPNAGLWQIGYTRDESPFCPSVTSAPHCLVAMAANPAGTTALERKERRVMSFLRHGMSLIILMAFVVFAAARHPSLSRDTTMDFAKRAVSELSDEQRSRIFDGVMRISDAPVTEVAAPEVAGSLPEDVPMQDLPSGITRDIPAVRGHKFVKFDDRILVVSSEGRLVVAMIPRYKLLP